jgi:hypothetical protein
LCNTLPSCLIEMPCHAFVVSHKFCDTRCVAAQHWICHCQTPEVFCTGRSVLLTYHATCGSPTIKTFQQRTATARVVLYALQVPDQLAPKRQTAGQQQQQQQQKEQQQVTKQYGSLARLAREEKATAAAAAGGGDEGMDADPAAVAHEAAAAQAAAAAAATAGGGDEEMLFEYDGDQQDGDGEDVAAAAAAAGPTLGASAEGPDLHVDAVAIGAAADEHAGLGAATSDAAAAAAAARAAAAHGEDMLLNTAAAHTAAGGAALAAATDSDGGLMEDAAINSAAVTGASADAAGSVEGSQAAAAAETAAAAAAAGADGPPVTVTLADATAAAASAAAQWARDAAVLACHKAVLELTDHLNPADPASYQTYFHLTRTLLKLVSDSSSSLVQLQALQQVLAWLLQLPAGQGRELAFSMLRWHDGWLQQLLQCWVAEEAETGCAVAQAAAAASEKYAAAFDSAAAAAAAAGGDRGIGSYLAGLCQLLLQLLGECCKQAAADAADAAEGNPADAAMQVGLQKLAGDLLGGTAAILLSEAGGNMQQQQQQRCALAGLWRSCLWVSLQAYKDGKGHFWRMATTVHDPLFFFFHSA